MTQRRADPRTSFADEMEDAADTNPSAEPAPESLLAATPRRSISRRQLITATSLAALGSVGARAVLAATEPSVAGPASLATERAVRLNPPDPRPIAPGAYDPAALYVALYGFPGTRTLGILGELSVDQAVVRARQVAAGYAGFGRPVVPTFELIGSVASAFAGSDGDYSNEFGATTFLPWINAAAANAFHVVIDLQSGRSRFPDQIREYEQLLRFPHVSVALDPEWRFDAPGRPGGGRVGTVDAPEVNETIEFLDAMIVRDGLPPKLLILHQFTPSMVTNKRQILSTPNVQVVMHMDGFGSLVLKRGSWNRMVADLPPGARTGWKNFYDEDRPTPTPAQTLNNAPLPMFVSYQ